MDKCKPNIFCRYGFLFVCWIFFFDRDRYRALQNRQKQMKTIGYDISYYKNLDGCGV